MSGVADLVIEAPDGRVVLVDHKCLPAGRASRHEELADFAGQLQAYAEAIAAARGADVGEIEAFVHLPLAGVVVPIRGSADSKLR